MELCFHDAILKSAQGLYFHPSAVFGMAKG
jgi:hypothetical protein